MSSYFSSFRRAAPVPDAPLDALPAAECAALNTLDARLKHVLVSGEGLHETDPWRSLSDTERRMLLLRFLRYQLLLVDKAEAQVKQVAKWRYTERPWVWDFSHVRGEEVGLPLTISSGRGRANEIVIFLPACLYIKANVDYAKQEVGIRTFFEHCAYSKDGLRASSAVMLIDFSDLSMKNVDLTTARTTIRIFLEFYPEVLSKILFINYPKWIYGTWKCLVPLLDARTISKVAWVSGGEGLRSELGKFFDMEQLPLWLGGGENVKEVELFTGTTLDAGDLARRLMDNQR